MAITVYDQQVNNQWKITPPYLTEDEIEADYEVVDPVWGSSYDWEMEKWDPIQQRMMLILIFVIVGVLLFAALAIPRIRHSVGNGETGEAQSIAGVTGSGAIAPLFTAEVQHWEPQIVQWASLYGLDPNMVATVMQIESCGDPQALSYAGAQGLFQVMPFHFQPGEDAFHPDTNAMRGMSFLADLVQQFGQPGLAFAGYNGGPGNAVKSYEAWPNEMQRYYKWSTGIYEDAVAGRAESNTLNEWLAAGGAGGCARAAQNLGLN